jgi:sensor histidine kinase YesM
MVAATIFYRFRLLKATALQSKVAQAEAQYSILESQMQPHFLFNSLNVLSELIYVDPDQATAMTQQLADLYREILNNSKTKFSTLESEISILKKYIEIQKIRFGDRIRFNDNVSPAFYNLQLPSLMLQTLVENAIKHGISPKKDGGEINLSVQKKDGLFEVCISNTGALYKGHKESKRSTGLQNTKNRLELTYGKKSAFSIYSDNEKTYVKFSITGRTS